MKKNSLIISNGKTYKIEKVVNNIALVSFEDARGLLDLKTGEFVCDLEDSLIVYDFTIGVFIKSRRIDDGSKNGKAIITVYDPFGNKKIVDNTLVTGRVDNKFDVVKANDGKYYIYDIIAYERGLNICEVAFDDIKRVDTKTLVVEKDGKKYIYRAGLGLNIKSKSNDIDIQNNVTVFTNDKGKRFMYNAKPNTLSKVYDEIDVQDDHIVLGRYSNGIWDVYNLLGKNIEKSFLFSIDCDELKYACCPYGRIGDVASFFIFKDNGKYGLITDKVARQVKEPKYYNVASPFAIAIPAECDNIYFDNGDIRIEKDGKCGLYVCRDDYVTYLEPKYDDIKHLDLDKNIYALYKDETCDIVKLGEPKRPLVSNCSIKEDSKDGLIFKKDDEEGLLRTGLGYFRKSISLLTGLHDVENLGNGYFAMSRNSVRGVSDGDVLILPFEFSNIKATWHKDSEGRNSLFFAIKRPDTDWALAKKGVGKHCNEVDFLTNYNSADIDFYPDFVALKKKDDMRIVDYNMKLLGEIPKETDIVIDKDERGDKVYRVGDDTYSYIDKNLIPLREPSLYVAAYEGDNGTVVVNSYNKKTYDDRCKKIEELSDEEFERILSKNKERDNSQKEVAKILVKTKDIK